MSGTCGSSHRGKGGAGMSRRIRTLLAALAVVAFAAINGGHPFGP
jgi:hypothetical protein